MDNPGETADPSPHRFRCPGCDEAVDVAQEFAGQLVRCPYCSVEFFASHDQSHLTVVDDTSPGSNELDRESAFDKLRIQNYTALRMGAIRARSWWIIGLCLAGLLFFDMVGKSILFVLILRRWGFEPTLRLIIAIAAGWFARHAWRRAGDFKREIARSAIAEPTVPPDFSTLCDGTQHWKNLENIR